MKLTYILIGLLAVSSSSFATELPFAVRAEIARMRQTVASAKKAEDKLKAKKTAIEKIIQIRKSSALIKADESSAIDAEVAKLQLEVRDDPQNLVGKWKCYATGLVNETYELKEDGTVMDGSKKGAWKIDGEKLLITWPPETGRPAHHSVDQFDLPINLDGMKGKSRALGVTLKKIK